MRSEKNRDVTEQTVGRGVVGRLRNTVWITCGWFSRAHYKLLPSLSSGVPRLLLRNLLLVTQVALVGSLRNTSREATVRCHRAPLGQREGWKRGSVVQLDNSLGQSLISSVLSFGLFIPPTCAHSGYVQVGIFRSGEILASPHTWISQSICEFSCGRSQGCILSAP